MDMAWYSRGLQYRFRILALCAGPARVLRGSSQNQSTNPMGEWQSLSSEQLSISCQAKLIKSFQFTEGVKEKRNKECSWPYTSARHSAGCPEASNLSFTLFLVFYPFLPLAKQLLFEWFVIWMICHLNDPAEVCPLGKRKVACCTN